MSGETRAGWTFLLVAGFVCGTLAGLLLSLAQALP